MMIVVVVRPPVPAEQPSSVIEIGPRRLDPRPRWLQPQAPRRRRASMPIALFTVVMASIATASGLFAGYLVGYGEAGFSCPAPVNPSSKKTNSYMRTV